MKDIIILFVLLVCSLLSACSISKKQTSYNTYLVYHRKYNMEQIFNYPSDVHFWKVQDSATYKMIDTLRYGVKYKDL
jgi:outer membrane biogenesis lipoprotein LolB